MTHRRGDAQAAAVDDAVGHADELHLKAADLHHVPGLDRDELGRGIELVLPELVFYEPQGEPRSVDGDIQLLEQKGERADVVLVGMGDHDGAHFVAVLQQVGKVGDHEVHAEHFGAGKHQPGVDDDNIVAVLDHGGVHPNLADASQGMMESAGPLAGAGSVWACSSDTVVFTPS